MTHQQPESLTTWSEDIEPLKFTSYSWPLQGRPTLFQAYAPPQYMDYGKMLQDISGWVAEFSARIAKGESTIADISKQTNVAITTLSPEPYCLKRAIPVHVQRDDGQGFIATFFDANISTSGETEEEAFSNLRSLIAESFDYLESVPIEELGPEPLRQLVVLREFVSSAQ